MTTFRFCFLADMQLGAYASFSGLDEADVARYAEQMGMAVEARPPVEGHEWDADRYRETVEAVNGLRPDLVVIGGDMVDDPSDRAQYDAFMEITNHIDPSVPVRWVPGNHDIAPDTVVPTPDSIASYRAAFGSDYFALDLGPLRIIGLDTVVIDHPEEVPGELEAQMAFLAGQLTGAGPSGLTPVLVGHHPLFTSHPDEPDDYWNLPLERRRPILDLIHDHGVPLMLAGHWHRNAHARDGAFEMVTSGPVGVPLGTDPSGFRIIEADGRALRHRYVAVGG